MIGRAHERPTSLCDYCGTRHASYRTALCPTCSRRWHPPRWPVALASHVPHVRVRQRRVFRPEAIR